MNSKPILFSGPMVRALLAGTKTQTRRVIKDRGIPPQFCGGRYDDKNDPDCWGWEDFDRGEWITLDQWCNFNFVPYRVGTHLWVKETWTTGAHLDHTRPRDIPRGQSIGYIADDEGPWLGKTRPSIFMPRWASRLTLTVTDVRVQRLQEISEADARAEGVSRCDWSEALADDGRTEWWVEGASNSHPTPRGPFMELWDSLNAPRGYGWDANPWVAAYSFTVHRCNVDQMEVSV